jgi:hypothetical protein
VSAGLDDDAGAVSDQKRNNKGDVVLVRRDHRRARRIQIASTTRVVPLVPHFDGCVKLSRVFAAVGVQDLAAKLRRHDPLVLAVSMLRMVVIAIMVLVLVSRRRFELEQRVSNELARVNSMALGIVATVAASKMTVSSARPPQQPRSCDLRRGHFVSGTTRRHCQGTNSRRSNEEEPEPRPSRRTRRGRHDAANVDALALPFGRAANQQRRPFGSVFAWTAQRPVLPASSTSSTATHSAVPCRDGALFFTFAPCHDEPNELSRIVERR